MLRYFKKTAKSIDAGICISERALSKTEAHVARYTRAYEQAENPARKRQLYKELVYWQRIKQAVEEKETQWEPQ